MAKLTVIVAVYNAEKFLRQCIDSIVDQTFRDLEIILVNDGSTDSSGKICEEYKTRDARIKVIQQANAGMPEALNRGLDYATGEWVTFCDSDDWLENDRYERIFQMLGSSDADVVIENSIIEEMPDGNKRIKLNFDSPFEVSAGPEVECLLASTQCVQDRDRKVFRLLGYYWDKLFRRKFVEKEHLRFMTGRLAVIDSLFVFQAISKARRIKGINCRGYHYRVRENSLTTSASYNSDLPKAYLAFYHELETSAKEWGGVQNSILIQQAMHVRSINSTLHCMQCTFFHPSNPDDRKSNAAKLRAFITDPFIQSAIYSKNNKYFTRKRMLFKYLLRLPWVWPVRMCFLFNTKIKKAD